MCKLYSAFLSLTFLTVVSAPNLVAQYYTVVDLGTLGGNYSQAMAINDNGQITGLAVNGAGETHAFLYHLGIMNDLGTLGGSYSEGLAINKSGQVTGDSITANGTQHAFLYTGSMLDLGTLNQQTGTDKSVGYGINDAGEVVGWSGGFDVISGGQGFIYHAGTMKQIPNLPGFTDLYAIAINNSGQVTGNALQIGGPYGDEITENHPFIYNGTNIIDIGTTPLGSSVNPRTINDSGTVAGDDSRNGDGSSYGAMRLNGQFQLLGTPSGYYSQAIGINNVGDVVGDISDTSYDNGQAMFYNSLLGMTFLNNNISASSPLVPYVARDINNHGQIVGDGVVNGQTHGFLLNPIHVRVLGKYILELAKGIEGCPQCQQILEQIAEILPPEVTDLSRARRQKTILEIGVLDRLLSRYAEAKIVSKANALLVRQEAIETLTQLEVVVRGAADVN